MRELSDIRSEIDQINTEMLALFMRRMALSSEVAETKRAHGLPTYNAAREQEILREISSRAGEDGAYARGLFTAIMALSKAKQATLRDEQPAPAQKAPTRDAPPYACEMDARTLYAVYALHLSIVGRDGPRMRVSDVPAAPADANRICVRLSRTGSLANALFIAETRGARTHAIFTPESSDDALAYIEMEVDPRSSGAQSLFAQLASLGGEAALLGAYRGDDHE